MEQIIFWLAGAFGVPVVNVVKHVFGLQGRAAVWLTAAVAAGLALLAVLLGEAAHLNELSPQQVFAAFGQVLAAATLAYKLLGGE